MRSPEERSWRHKTPPGEPSKDMIEQGVKTLRQKGRLFLPAGVPRRWLEEAVRETWKAMQRVAGSGQ